MKRQSILFILLLLLTLTTLCGCSNTKSANKESLSAAPMELSIEESVEEANDTTVEESAVLETSITADTDTEAFDSKMNDTVFEDVIGIFEGLEDNHTALFSFDGVEVVFFFEAPEVQAVLSEAVIGSNYTLSYTYDSTSGLNILFQISE